MQQCKYCQRWFKNRNALAVHLRDCEEARIARRQTSSLEAQVEELQQKLFVANETIAGLTAYVKELEERNEVLGEEYTKVREAFLITRRELLKSHGDMEEFFREIDSIRTTPGVIHATGH